MICLLNPVDKVEYFVVKKCENLLAGDSLIWQPRKLLFSIILHLDSLIKHLLLLFLLSGHSTSDLWKTQKVCLTVKVRSCSLCCSLFNRIIFILKPRFFTRFFLIFWLYLFLIVNTIIVGSLQTFVWRLVGHISQRLLFILSLTINTFGGNR